MAIDKEMEATGAEDTMPDTQVEISDSWSVYGKTLSSRFFIGTALYPSPEVMQQSIAASKAEVVTVSLRRQSPQQQGGNHYWELIKASGCELLPNTAGCHTAKEAVTLAQMSRELFQTDWIKLEVIGDDYNLQPDPFATLEAAETLVKMGFKVFPYCTDDLVLCQKLRDVGCEVLMPWGSPIGTGLGLLNPHALTTIRERLPDMTLLIDAGLGKPSDACRAMELGFDAVLLNTAVAQAHDPVVMAEAFANAIAAGRSAWLSGMIEARAAASASTPTLGMPFWHQN